MALQTLLRGVFSQSQLCTDHLPPPHRSLLQGVNLGSWLVLEQWMVPDLFALVDGTPYGEQQLMLAAQQQGLMDVVTAAITAHRCSALVASRAAGSG